MAYYNAPPIYNFTQPPALQPYTPDKALQNEEGEDTFGGEAVSSGSGISGLPGLSEFSNTVGSALSGLNPNVNIETPLGDVNVSAADVALGLGLTALTGVPGIGTVANAIGSAFGPSTGTAFGVGEQTGSGISSGQVAGYGTTTGGPTDLGINAYGQAVDPNAEAVLGMEADVEAAAQAQAEAQAAATADAMGMGGGSPGEEMGGHEFAQGGILQLGGYSANRQGGAETSKFYLRTPDRGIPLGDSVSVTGNYDRSTAEVTPQAMGIPQEAIEYFRLKYQEQKSTSYNVGIRAMFPDGVVPDFMDKVLRPKSANVNYGRSESTFQNVLGNTFTNSDRSRGIGAQGQILRGMFGDNAPTVTGQYFEPNRSDKSFSGSVDIPMGNVLSGGNVSLYGSQNINEERPKDTSFGVRGKFNF